VSQHPVVNDGRYRRAAYHLLPLPAHVQQCLQLLGGIAAASERVSLHHLTGRLTWETSHAVKPARKARTAAGWCANTKPEGVKAMPAERDPSKNLPVPDSRNDPSRMDDFQVIAERQRVMANLAALTDQYRALNQEIQRRDTLKWMLAR
jgi:hypothetical protein